MRLQLTDETRLKLHALRRWTARQLGSIEHERRVARISGQLFDLTWPWHKLGVAERRLLEWGAIVHDVGRSVDDATHPMEGARLLLEEQYMPLSRSERRALAYLTRYHRGAVPDAGRDEILARGDDHETLRTVLGLLRAADGLDSRALEPPRLILSRTGRRLRIRCLLEDVTSKARRTFSRRKKFRLLEETLDCRADVEILPASVELIH